MQEIPSINGQDFIVNYPDSSVEVLAVRQIQAPEEITSLDFWIESSVPNNLEGVNYRNIPNTVAGTEKTLGVPLLGDQMVDLLTDNILTRFVPQEFWDSVRNNFSSLIRENIFPLYSDYFFVDPRPYNVTRSSIEDSFSGSQVSGISLHSDSVSIGARAPGLPEQELISYIGDKWFYSEATKAIRQIPSVTRRESTFALPAPNTEEGLISDAPPSVSWQFGDFQTSYSEADRRAIISDLQDDVNELNFTLKQVVSETYADDEFQEDKDTLPDGTVSFYNYSVDTYKSGIVSGEYFDELTGALNDGADAFLFGRDSLTGMLLEYDYVGSVLIYHFDDFSFGDAAIVQWFIDFDDAPLFEGYLNVNDTPATALFENQNSLNVIDASNGSIPFPNLGGLTLNAPDNFKSGTVVISDGMTLEQLIATANGVDLGTIANSPF